MLRARSPLILKFAFALFIAIRALMPTGWMPMAMDGKITFQPCPSASSFVPASQTAAPHQAAIAMDHGAGHATDRHSDDHESASASEICPFGIATNASADLPPPIALSLAFTVDGLQGEAPVRAIILQRLRSSAQARAPPVSV